MEVPRVEVLCVGTELVSGKINTHISYLAHALEPLGLSIARESSIRDSLKEIHAAVQEAFGRSQILILCGGLGPTFDDLTREGTASALGLLMHYQPKLYATIHRRYRRHHHHVPEENKKQAFVIEGARILPNHYGSAPGQWLDFKGKTVILLPGPFQELQPMFEKELPELKVRYAARVAVRKKIFHLCGIPESVADERLTSLVYVPKPGLDFTILAQIGLVDLHVTARTDSAKKTDRLLSRAGKSVRRLVGSYIFGTDDETLESTAGALLRRHHLKLAAAESCTGGMLSSRMTSVPGSSDYFVGGVISYANEIKRAELGVTEATLKKFGAVSEPCAREMAAGVLKRMEADCALSITGIAGPGGGSKSKPVGLTYIAFARRGHPTRVQKHFFFGTRDQICSRATIQALTLLMTSLKK